MSRIPEREVKRVLGQPATQYIWRRYLDPVMDALMAADADDLTYRRDLRLVARAYANALAAIQHTENADATVRRAMTRWEIRQGKRPWESTPGYGWADESNDDPTEQGRYGMFGPDHVHTTPEGIAATGGATAIVCAPKRTPRKVTVAKAAPAAAPIDPATKLKIANLVNMGMPFAAIKQKFNLTDEQAKALSENPY